MKGDIQSLSPPSPVVFLRATVNPLFQYYNVSTLFQQDQFLHLTEMVFGFSRAGLEGVQIHS